MEEIIGTAYHNQTNLWSSAGLIGGVNRVFGDYHLFLLTERGRSHELPPLTLPPGESVGEMAFYAHEGAAAFLLQRQRHGQLFTQTIVVDAQGQRLRQWEQPATPPHDLLTGKAFIGTTLLHATDNGILKETSKGEILLSDAAAISSYGDWLYPHPAGLLIQQPHALYLAQA